MAVDKFQRLCWSLLIVIPVSLLPVACDDSPPVDPASETSPSQNKTGQQNESLAAPDSEPYPELAKAAGNMKTGEFRMLIENGKISLASAWSSRIAILEELSQRAGFELTWSAGSDQLVEIEQGPVALPELLATLLQGVEYAARYQARPRANGFSLVSLRVGPSAEDGEAVGERIEAYPAIDLRAMISPGAGEISLGSDAESSELASRLQFGSDEQKILALDDLDLDTTGMNAAYQVYMQTTSATVRSAVLEWSEGDDRHLARMMTLMSLQSLDAGEATQALINVESLDDDSLAPQVRALLNYHDASVRVLAGDVLESIAEDDRDDADQDATRSLPPAPGIRGVRVERGYSGER